MAKRNSATNNSGSNKNKNSKSEPESDETSSDNQMNASADAESPESGEHDVDVDDEEAAALAAQYSDEESDAGEGEEEAETAAPTEGAAASNEAKPIDKRTLPKGPRPVYFICSAFVMNAPQDLKEHGIKRGDSGVVQKQISVTMPAKAKDFFDVKKAHQEAISIFEKEFGVKPSAVSAPVYTYLGEKAKPSKPRESVKFDENFTFTGERSTAIHVVKDIPWKVLIQHTDREGEVFAMYQGIAEPMPEGKKKPQTPPARGLRISALRDIKPLVKTQPPATA